MEKGEEPGEGSWMCYQLVQGIVNPHPHPHPFGLEMFIAKPSPKILYVKEVSGRMF